MSSHGGTVMGQQGALNMTQINSHFEKLEKRLDILELKLRKFGIIEEPDVPTVNNKTEHVFSKSAVIATSIAALLVIPLTFLLKKLKKHDQR